MTSFQPAWRDENKKMKKTVTRIGQATFYLGKQVLKLSTII